MLFLLLHVFYTDLLMCWVLIPSDSIITIILMTPLLQLPQTSEDKCLISITPHFSHFKGSQCFNSLLFHGSSKAKLNISFHLTGTFSMKRFFLIERGEGGVRVLFMLHV